MADDFEILQSHHQVTANQGQDQTAPPGHKPAHYPAPPVREAVPQVSDPPWPPPLRQHFFARPNDALVPGGVQNDGLHCAVARVIADTPQNEMLPPDVLVREQQRLVDELYKRFPPDDYLGNRCGTPALAIQMLNAYGWSGFAYSIHQWDLAGVDANGANANLTPYLSFFRQAAIDPVVNTVNGTLIRPPRPVLCLVDVSSWPTFRQDSKVVGMHWVVWEAMPPSNAYPYSPEYWITNAPGLHQTYIPAKLRAHDFGYAWENRFVLGYPKFVAVLPQPRG
ncbi:MAG TPA: hypothetical protein VGF56_03435 [Rhizomicrobium sp.]|jgi:hypothetical protein